MNPDVPKTPREEMEAWLTALLLGELSEGEAAAVRALMAHDAELAKLHDRLKEAIVLVRETVPQMESPPLPTEPLKLSEARRQRLLTSFKIPPLKIEDRKPKRQFQFRLTEALVVLTAVAVLAAMLLPALSRSKSRARRATTLGLFSVARSETGEEISAPSATAPPADSAVLESTRRPAQQRLSESKSEGDRRILDNRGQISGQYAPAVPAYAPPVPALRQSDASGRGVDPTTGLPVDSLAAATRKSTRIVLPPIGESAGATEGSKVTLGNEFSWNMSERNGRGLDDGRTQLGQSTTLFAGDPQWTGVLEKPEASSANAFQGRYAYVSPGSGPSSDFFLAKPESAAPPQTEATITLSRSRMQEALKNSSDAKVVEDQVAAGGAFIQPTTGLPAETLPRGGAIADNITPAAPEQTAFMRRYGLPPAKQAGGVGGGGAGGGIASSGSTPLGSEPTPSQTVPGYDVAHAVSVLGDLPAEGKLFRSEQSASETPRLGFSLLGPKSDKPALEETREFGAVALDHGLQSSDPLKDGTTLAGKETSHTMDSDWFAGRPLARQGGVAAPAAPPVAAAGDGLGRQPAPIVLSLVEQETVDAPATDLAKREVFARNGAVPQRLLRESPGPKGSLAVTASVRGDELLAESRVNDAIADRSKNPGQSQQEDRGRAGERVPTAAEEVVLQKNEGEASAKARSYYEAKGRLEELQRFRTLQNLKMASQGTDSAAPQSAGGIDALKQQSDKQEKKVREAQKEVEQLRAELNISGPDSAAAPTSYASTNLIFTGKGRQTILGKLDRIRFEPDAIQNLGLGEVVRYLSDEAKKRDPEKKGVNFLISPDTTPDPVPEVDPTTGLPIVPAKEPVDMNTVAISLNAKDGNIRLADLLDSITKASEIPIKYSIEDYGVVFSRADAEDHPAPRKSSTNGPIPQPEIQTRENNFSTFSLNVSDVSFKLAAASLEQGQMPNAASVRSEEFINAFDYRDPEPSPGAPIAFAWERARYPFAHNRDLLRFSLKTAAAGRQAGRPLNIVLLLDNSGSMERADRVQIVREALRVLAGQLQPQDKLSVITFSRTARLVADGVSGDKAGEVTEQVSGLTPQGGTNLEDAMNLAYQTALRHYLAGGINRVVLLTDGAANLGNVEPDSLKQKVETHRKQGVALDCFGIGWEGFNDDLLEVLSRNGDGRYGFINSPEEAATDFAGQLAGALKVAASDVKVQVEFNPKRVTAYRQIGYAKHQLTKEQFRDNTVDAAEIAAQEAGNALYTVEVNPAGEGPLGTVRVRFRFAGTWEYREQAWDVPYNGNAVSLEQSSPAMRLAASASAFSEWLAASPFAAEVTPDRVLGVLSGVPEVFGADARPKKLEWMIRQAKSLEGR